MMIYIIKRLGCWRRHSLFCCLIESAKEKNYRNYCRVAYLRLGIWFGKQKQIFALRELEYSQADGSIVQSAQIISENQNSYEFYSKISNDLKFIADFFKEQQQANEQQTNEQQTVVSLVGMLFFLFTVGGGTGGIF